MDEVEVRDLIIANKATERLADLVAGYLTDLAEQRRDIAAIHHPLGFIYVPMMRDDRGLLRLHLWMDGGTPDGITTSPYHMHTWNLASYVMCGSLQNQLLSTDPHSGPLGPYQVFEIVGNRQRGELQATDEEVYATIDSVEDVKAGEIYHIPAGRYHTTVNTSEGDLVTVAYVQRVPGTMERNLGPVDVGTHVVVREDCPSEEVAKVARSVLARLS